MSVVMSPMISVVQLTEKQKAIVKLIGYNPLFLFPCIEFVLNVGHLGAMEFGVANAAALLMAIIIQKAEGVFA